MLTKYFRRKYRMDVPFYQCYLASCLKGHAGPHEWKSSTEANTSYGKQRGWGGRQAARMVLYSLSKAEMKQACMHTIDISLKGHKGLASI